MCPNQWITLQCWTWHAQHYTYLADICLMYMQNHTNSSTSQPKMMLKIVKTTLKTQMCPNQWRTLWVEHDIPSNNIILLTLLYVHTKSHKQFNVSTKIDVKKCNNFSYLTKCVPINQKTLQRWTSHPQQHDNFADFSSFQSNVEHHDPSNTICLLTFAYIHGKTTQTAWRLYQKQYLKM